MNELDMLRAARPEVPAPSQEVLDTALASLLEEDAPRRVIRRLPRRRTLMAGGIAAVAAVGVGLIPVLSGGGTATANAAVVLREAAAVTRTDKGMTPKPSQWVFIESKVQGIPGYGVMWAPGEDAQTSRPTTRFQIRSWYPAIGAEILNNPPRDPKTGVRGPLKFTTVVQQVNGRERRLGLLPDSRGWDPNDQKFVKSMPTEPGALLKRIYAHADTTSHHVDFDRNQQAVEAIADLMDGHIPQALRAALFEALSRIPKVRLDRDAVDNAGRHGIGFSYTGRDVTTQIIVARGTYRYLGDRLTAIRNLSGGIKAGATLRWSAQLRIAVVDKPRQLPR